MSKILTNEGAVCYDHTLDNALEFFSKAGSLRDLNNKKTPSFYSNGTTALDLFKLVWASGNHEMAMKLLFWLRDPRGGAGNRSGFRSCIKWLVETDSKWVASNVGLIPEHGRFDDLRVLFNTHLDQNAAKIWGDAITANSALAAKWAKREDKSILSYFRKIKSLKDIGDFRRLLAKVRKEHIVEHKMCTRNWNEIEYRTIPSVAMTRYTKSFAKHDFQRFEIFKKKVEAGEEKINASVSFPHDLVRLVKNHGDKKIADLQFAALPNYLEGTDQRIMCLVDSSGSMEDKYGGTVEVVDVAEGLGLYCSDRLGKSNPFYRKFMEFESESHLTDWSDKSFSEAVSNFNGAYGATRIHKALDSILNYAKLFKATNEQIPNVLIILSDMQFHSGTFGGTDTEVERCIGDWVKAGYNAPRIVYWNLAGYAGSPATVDTKNVGLISGFSPAILTAVFGGEDFSPRAIMIRAIEKYKVSIPS